MSTKYDEVLIREGMDAIIDTAGPGTATLIDP